MPRLPRSGRRRPDEAICCSGHECFGVCNAEMDYPDPKDAVFYEVVMEKRKSNDAYLVTGNIKHFPEKHFVVTPREMFDIILGKD